MLRGDSSRTGPSPVRVSGGMVLRAEVAAEALEVDAVAVAGITVTMLNPKIKMFH